MRPVLASLLVALALPAAAAAAERPRPDRVRAAVDRAERSGALPAGFAAGYREEWRAARRAHRRLDGRPQRELGSVIRATRGIADRRALTVARMPAVFLTLQRNREWWTTRRPPTAGSPGEPDAKGRRCRARTARARAARVRFPGSRLVWQYYRGSGLQLQVNATWAAAASLARQTTPDSARMLRELLDELLPLAVRRSGFVTWEYLFAFGGGRPPWTSALSQASAARALALAAGRLERPELLALAVQAAGAFSVRAPRGLAIPLARDGRWYPLYAFAPRLRVLNAHLHAVIALHDVHGISGDRGVRRAYLDGLRAARRRIGSFDTGRWSKYAHPGREADLNYHVLNRDLARALCRRSGEKAICRAERRFTAYLERRCPRVRTAAAARAAATAEQL